MVVLDDCPIKGIYKAFVPQDNFPPRICPLHYGQTDSKPHGLKVSVGFCVKTVINENGMQSLAASPPPSRALLQCQVRFKIFMEETEAQLEWP